MNSLPQSLPFIPQHLQGARTAPLCCLFMFEDLSALFDFLFSRFKGPHFLWPLLVDHVFQLYLCVLLCVCPWSTGLIWRAVLQQSPQSEQQDHPNYSAMPLDLNSMKPFFQIGFVICYRFRAWRSFPIDLFDQFSLVFAWLITACLKWGQIPSQITCVLLGVCYAQFSKRIFFLFSFSNCLLKMRAICNLCL